MLKKILVLIIVGSMFMTAKNTVAQTKGQDKLLAKRAATVDAYRNLTEKVMGLRIDSQTYVRDFVAESDQIRTDVDAFLKNARISRERFQPDGTCEVDVEMPIKEVVGELKRIKKQYQHLGHWKTIKFDKIYQTVVEDVITATGYGIGRKSAEEPDKAVAGITAGIPGWENVTARGRLMAQRAALADAYRNLTEKVMGLRIDSQTYVRDFVAESDQIRTDVDSFIKGISPVGNYRYLPGGICEVDVEVNVRKVIEKLVKIRKKIRFWQNVRYKTIGFEKITEYYPEETVKATGSGTSPAKYIKDLSSGQQAVSEGNAPSWAKDVISVTGYGVASEGASGTEARLMAERAAKLDAMRNLAEKIYGVQIDSTTTIKDFVVSHDEIKAQVDTVIKSAEVSNTRYMSDGSVEVELAMPLKNIWEIVKQYRS